MSVTTVSALTLLSLGVLSAGTLLYLMIGARRASKLIDTLGGGSDVYTVVRRTQMLGDSTLADEQFEQIKEATRIHSAAPEGVSWQSLFFRAGCFSPSSQRGYKLLRLLAPLFGLLLGAALTFISSICFGVIGALLGLAIGFQIPRSIIDRAIARRDEDVMFYLPLVVEQLVIGVSSSLDIAPCISAVVAMAEERDAHNPVTELLRYVLNYQKSGANLEEALNEVGALAGHTELKHVFMSLAQVSRHGGEITRQLQELANSVASQRENKIEARIKRLELEATGPVALVFIAFMAVLMTGLGAQLVGVLG